MKLIIRSGFLFATLILVACGSEESGGSPDTDKGTAPPPARASQKLESDGAEESVVAARGN